jgi:hypothetical protein
MRTVSTYPDKFEQVRFSYAEVEEGLAVALAIGGTSRTLFRSRIKHFQRLGVTGERPGKGAPLKYDFAQAAKLVIVLLLADVGLAPIACVKLVSERWERDLRGQVRQAIGPGTRDAENPWFLTLRLEAMRGPWAKQSAVAAIGAFRRTQHCPALSEEQREAQKARLPKEQYAPWLAHLQEPQEDIGIWLDHPEGRNFCVFSLSYVLHRLKDHLDRNRAKS